MNNLSLPHSSLITVPAFHRDGHVSLQEYMAFMISRETENVKSSEEIESAFRALSSEGKPYVTKEELYQVGLGEGKIPWAQLMLKGAPHIHTLRSMCVLAELAWPQLLTRGHLRSALADLTTISTPEPDPGTS